MSHQSINTTVIVVYARTKLFNCVFAAKIVYRRIAASVHYGAEHRLAVYADCGIYRLRRKEPRANL